MSWFLAGLGLLVGVAGAQGLDGSGPALPPPSADSHAPLWTTSPFLPGEEAVELSAVLEYARAPLVRYWDEGDQHREEVLVDHLLGVDLGASWSFHRRASLGVGLPLWLGSSGEAGGGPTPGDLRLQLCVQAWSAPGVAVGVVPLVGLPFGNAERYLGEPGLFGGVHLSAGFKRGPWAAHLEVGPELIPAADEATLPGGARLSFSGAVGWTPRPAVGIHLEARGRPALAHADAPVEVGLTARGRAASGWTWMAGLGRGLSDAVGSPSVRAFVGVGLGPRASSATEVEPASLRVLRVVGPGGAPVGGAEVRLAGELVGHTDPLGELGLASRRWRDLLVEAPGLQRAHLDLVPVGQAPVVVELDWVPVPFVIRVVDRDGEAVDAELILDGPRPVASPEVDAVGTRTYSLVPGAWRVEVRAPGLGTQVRTLQVEPGGPGGRVDVVLAPALALDTRLVLRVVDPDGHPVDDARVAVDGFPLGTTGQGGMLSIEGLAAGPATVSVSADRLAPVDDHDVVVAAEASVDLVLDWLPGSVRLSVSGPDGPIGDALARLAGPVHLPPVRVGPGGRRLFVLRPGLWTLFVSSPSLGVQERRLVVTDEPGRLLDVRVVLQPAEEGPADLILEVVDRDGAPLADAAVALDGLPLGDTSSTGLLRVDGLRTGPRRLDVRRAGFRDHQRRLLLVEGPQEIDAVLRRLPGSVLVSALGPEGQPVDALVRMTGPEQVPVTALGSDGTHLFRLPAGRWSMLISSGELGLQARDLVVPPDHDGLIAVDVRLHPPEGGDAELVVEVVDPRGRPVEGAEVQLDGISLGATSSAGTLHLSSVAPGPRRVRVGAAGLDEQEQVVEVGDAAHTARVALDWAPGAVEVEVRGVDGPVADAVLRLSGPDSLPPVRVGPLGSRRFQLAPGVWHALVSSATHGMEERTFEVGEEAPVLVGFELEPPAEGEASLVLRVRDEDGQPVVGAQVRVDGESAGRTSPGGDLLLSRPGAGTVLVEVAGPDDLGARAVRLGLSEGIQERLVVLSWPRTAITVVARDPDGHFVDAEVLLEGPEVLPPFSLGPDGQEEVLVRPGAWTVLVTAPGMGVARADLDVIRGGGPRWFTFDLVPPSATVRPDLIEIHEHILFDWDEATLRDESWPTIDAIANVLLAHPELVRVEIQGHTDNSGGLRYNLVLSERRVDAVRYALIVRGVAEERLIGKGYGPLRPIADNATDEGRSLNRRVELRILERAATRAPRPDSPAP